jgi:hypothetical protein
VPKDIHCPNPGCTHVFPAAATAGVAALVCPKCGGVFQIKRTPPRPADSPAGESIPAPPAPAAKPSTRRPMLAWTVAGLIVFVTLGLMTGAIYRQRGSTPTGPEPFRSPTHNYSVRLPDPPWQRDAELARRVGGVIAFRRENPSAAVVLAVRDFPKFVPTPAELRDEAITRMRKLPIEKMDREEKSEGSFGGRPAGQFVFQGVLDEVTVSGVVQYLTYEGAAYWFYRWCPQADVPAVTGDLADIADRFAFLDQRPDWQPPRKTFTGTKLAYTLTSEGDRWDKSPHAPESYDPAADLVLIGEVQPGVVDPPRQATLLVLLLPADKEDPIARAEKHLLERQRDLYAETTLAGAIDKFGTGPDRIRELRLVNTKDRERLVMLRVLKEGERLVVICAECDYARRELWDTDFRKLLESYQPPK